MIDNLTINEIVKWCYKHKSVINTDYYFAQHSLNKYYLNIVFVSYTIQNNLNFKFFFETGSNMYYHYKYTYNYNYVFGFYKVLSEIREDKINSLLE